jgi:hypothetical protein
MLGYKQHVHPPRCLCSKGVKRRGDKRQPFIQNRLVNDYFVIKQKDKNEVWLTFLYFTSSLFLGEIVTNRLSDPRTTRAVLFSCQPRAHEATSDIIRRKKNASNNLSRYVWFLIMTSRAKRKREINLFNTHDL